MTAPPVLILAAPSSGAAAVAGMLHHGAGLSLGQTIDPTIAHPWGGHEHAAVSEAIRSLLSAMDRDVTCPPTSLDPARLDLTRLRTALNSVGPGTLLKAAGAPFVLPALGLAGLGEARLVVVVRAAHDTVASYSMRTRIGEYEAEAIIDAYRRRLADIVDRFEVGVVEFSADAEAVLDQVERLARTLGAPWNRERAAHEFDSSGIVNRSPRPDSSAPLASIVARRKVSDGEVGPTVLAECNGLAGPDWPLSPHVGPQHRARTASLWRLATPTLDTADVEVSMARSPFVDLSADAHGPARVRVEGPASIARELVGGGHRPDRLVLTGCLDGANAHTVRTVLGELHEVMPVLSELVLDLVTKTDPNSADADPLDRSELQVVADETGWSIAAVGPVSARRIGVRLRRGRVGTSVTDGDATPHHDVDVLETSIRSLQRQLERAEEQRFSHVGDSLDEERRRADRAEQELASLRSDRVVRLALALARPLRRGRTMAHRLRKLVSP